MKISILKKNAVDDEVIVTVAQLVARIPWPERRQAMAEVTNQLLEGKPRVAEAVFGWGRETVKLGMKEQKTGIVCLNASPPGRRKPKIEEKHPKLLVDIAAIMMPNAQADPRLRTTLAYTNMTAAAVRQALLDWGWQEEILPKVRTISNLLNRQRYRLRTVVKTPVQKNATDGRDLRQCSSDKHHRGCRSGVAPDQHRHESRD